jgi:hypothetical protein
LTHGGLRNPTILDFCPIGVPFAIHHFRWMMKYLFNKKYKETGNEYWKNLADNYSRFQATLDYYRYNEKEALEKYEKERRNKMVNKSRK